MLLLCKDLRGQPLDAAQHLEFLVVALGVGHAAGMVLQDLGAGVADGVHRMAHAVDQAAAVAGLLADDLAQELPHLVIVGGIFHILQDVVQLVHDLQVGAAVLGTFQRADGRRDGRVGVGAGAGQHTAGEGGAVAAAVVGVDHQAEVQKPCLLVGELLVGAVGAQDVLRRALALGGQMKVHAGPVVHPALDLVGVDHHGGQLGDEVDALPQDVGQAGILGVLVVAVHGQHAAGHLVHQVGGGGVEDHVVRKAPGQFPVMFQQLAELGVLLPVGQRTEEQQPHHLLKEETVVVVRLGGQGIDVDAAVDQPAGNGHNGAVRRFVVADNAGHIGDAGQHAGTVQVAQTALDAHLVRQFGVQVRVVLHVLVAKQFQFIRLQGRYVRVIHRQAPLSGCIFIRAACACHAKRFSVVNTVILVCFSRFVKKKLKILSEWTRRHFILLSWWAFYPVLHKNPR